MPKATNQIIEEISDILIVYLKAGNVGINSFIKKANLNITDIEQLLHIHYLLKDEVKQFVCELPFLIRRFKTSTIAVKETYFGETRGQVDWFQTMKERYKVNPKDLTIFSCREQSRNYDITENLVLKEFLQTIYTILFIKIDSDHLVRYEYFKEWKDLKRTIEDLLRKNVYLSRVDTRVKVTNRMIEKTLGHRNPLYRQAASLLRDYRQLITRKLDEILIQSLLKETFIFPDKEEVLFELYWVMKLIQHNSKNAKLQLIDGRNNLVASWEDDECKYDLYHDSMGSNQLDFNITKGEVMGIPHPYINRKVLSMDRAHDIATKVFGKSFNNNSFWSGRPDIIVEVYDRCNSKLTKVIIGEVKHTESIQYAITGLRELLDYIAFVKGKSGCYLNNSNSVEVSGMLFVGNIDLRESYLDEVRVVAFDNWCEKVFHV